MNPGRPIVPGPLGSDGRRLPGRRPSAANALRVHDRPRVHAPIPLGPGSLAFWDSRASARIVPTDLPPGARRAVQRITLAGDLPVGTDGESSYPLQGDRFQ